MADGAPSPLAEAIEMMADAARAYLDGPVAHLRASVDRSTQPGYDADAAAADAAGFALQLARCWWGGFNAVVDATALLSSPPGDAHRFEVPVPPVAVASTVRVVGRTWTWLLDPEPDDVTIDVLPPVLLSPGIDRVRLRAAPRLLGPEPSWDVVLELVPLGSPPGQGTHVTVRLDATTEQLDVP